MKIRRFILQILQLSFLFQSILSDSDICTSDFEIRKSELCGQLSTDQQYCFFIDNQCKPWFKECNEYAPTNNNDFDENICTKITPSNVLKKCQKTTTGGINKCT